MHKLADASGRETDFNMKSKRRIRPPRALYQRWVDRGQFLALCLLLLLALLMGGASRGDVSSLVILRPAAILLLGYGLWGLEWEQVKAYRYLFGLAAAMLAVTLIQLVPLPAAVWSRLPGRELIAEIDRLAGLGAVWRPISLAPAATWNGFYAMMVPLGVLVLGARLTIEESCKLLALVIALGLMSALLALLQILGPADGPFYFYDITNPGAAVGLFANRNHQAALLASMFPMLAVFASLSGHSREQADRRTGLAIAAGVFLTPLIFITGSRMGLVVAALGVASSLWLYRHRVRGLARARDLTRPKAEQSGARRHRPPQQPRRAWGLALVGLLSLGLSLVTITMGRGVAYQRIMKQDAAEEFRFKAWGSITQMVGEYFPVGSGLGSFAEVYQVHEPRSLLATTYFNHAHNDWLEVPLTGGLPALALLLCACGLTFARAIQLRRSAGMPRTEQLFARLGLVLVIMFAIASLTDYPLRTPGLASLCALAALWAATPLRRLAAADAVVAQNRGAATTFSRAVTI
jgi:O-antigen ligase